MVANGSEAAAFNGTGFGCVRVVSSRGREEDRPVVARVAGIFGRASATAMTTAGAGRSVGAACGFSDRMSVRSMVADRAGAIGRSLLWLFAARVDGMNMARATMAASRAGAHGMRTAVRRAQRVRSPPSRHRCRCRSRSAAPVRSRRRRNSSRIHQPRLPRPLTERDRAHWRFAVPTGARRRVPPRSRDPRRQRRKDCLRFRARIQRPRE